MFKYPCTLVTAVISHMGWRVLDSQIADPYFVTAADEVIAEFHQQQRVPNTLHFYQRHPPAISLGRFRKVHEDVDLDACQTQGVLLVRRSTGGGSIYTDRGCLIYSLAFQQSNDTKQSAQSVFHSICTALVDSLAVHDIAVCYKPPNDLLLNGKKVSGSAQLRKKNTILLHGTILVSTNIRCMNAVLRNPPKKKVTTLKAESENPPSIAQLKTSITKTFEQLFDTSMQQGSFSYEERLRIEILSRKRYHNTEWTMKR